jgi:hypothetical protein
MTANHQDPPNSLRDGLISRIRDDSKRRLAACLEQQEFFEYRSHRQSLQEALDPRIPKLADDFTSEVEALQASEKDVQSSKDRAKKTKLYFYASLIIIALTWLYFACLTPYIYLNSHTYSWLIPTYRSAGSVVFLEFTLALGMTLIVAAHTFIISLVSRRTAELEDRLNKRTERYRIRLQNVVAQELRLAIPSLNLSGTQIEFEHTPALVELAFAEIVSTTAVKEVEDFVTTHTASALGLSAPRGAGKTTILRHLTRLQDNTISVYVPAPVRYEPNELLARIFEDLATKYLGENWEQKNLRSNQQAVLLTSAFSFYVGVGIFVLGIKHLYAKTNVYEWIGSAVAAASIYFLMRIMVQIRPEPAKGRQLNPIQGQSRVSDISARRQARRILVGSRWQQQKSSSRTFGSAPWSGALNASRQDTLTLNQREIGRARLVKEFQDFVLLILRNRSIDRIVIAIDELDKLSDPADAISVVSELKDILHFEGTHVLVSVSEDALDRFIARGMPKRDVFDSSFDEIIELPALPPEEAVLILQSRATGFPRSWAVICYALSGGNTRDLLRYARRCVSLYRVGKGATTDALLERLINEVAEERVRSVLRASGVLARLTEHGRRELEAISSKDGGEKLYQLKAFVSQIDDDQCLTLLRWLEWAIEVTHILIGFKGSDFEHVLKLASVFAREGNSIGRS